MDKALLLFIGMSAAPRSAALPTISSYPFVMLEHVNINSGGWTSELDTFYVNGLGFVYDGRSAPILNSLNEAGGNTSDLTWCNIGLQQLHFPSDEPQRVNGVIGLQYANLSEALLRMHSAGITGKMTYDAEGMLSRIKVTSPNGNRFWLEEQGIASAPVQRMLGVECQRNPNCEGVEPSVSATGKTSWLGPAPFIPPRDGEYALPGGRSLGLGMSYVTLYTATDTARKICDFYNYLFMASAYVGTDPQLGYACCTVPMGYGQFLRYTENPKEQRPYDGHHIGLYVRDFAKFYERAAALGLNWDNPRFPQLSYRTLEQALGHNEFRIKNLLDLRTNETVYELEHEIRSLNHPGFCCSSLVQG